MTVFQAISTLGIAFWLTSANLAPAPTHDVNDGIDWLYVLDENGGEMINDGDYDCITVLLVNEDGTFETHFIEDGGCNN